MKRSRQLSIMALCAVAALGITVSSCDEDASNSSVKAKSGDSCASVECEDGLVCNADKVCEKAETPDPGDEPGKVGDDCDADHVCADDLECKDGKCAEKTADPDPEDPPVDPGPGPKEDPCEGVNCPDGKQCLNAQCLDPDCIVDGAEKACDAGQMCSKGECIDDGCQDNSCGEGEVCSKGLCEDALCLEKAIVCNDGSTCVKGACVDNACLGQTCDTGLTCSKGACMYPACVGKDACDPGKACNEAGDCVFANAPALNAEIDKQEIDESGASAAITVTLNNPPSKSVSVTCTLSPESAAAEASVDCSSILFDSSNYDGAQTIHVVGLPDNVIDADQTFTLTITTVSEDADFNGLEKSFEITNKNIDKVGVTVNATNLQTSESGGSAVFTVVLSAKPEANVTFEVSSSNPDYGYIDGVEEGSDKLVVTFTPENWDVPQEIKVVGKDEAEDKNGPNTEEHKYQVEFSKTSSEDPNFQDLEIEPIDVVNLDNDIADVFIDQENIETAEMGDAVDVNIHLGVAPKKDVNIELVVFKAKDSASEESEEVELSETKFVLTKDNYLEGKTISIKSVDDHRIDGDQDYFVYLYAASTDPSYKVIEKWITGKSLDKNTAGFRFHSEGTTVSEDETPIEIGVTLTAIPEADVNVVLNSSNKYEMVASPDKMTFTPDNWDTVQKITVKGVDDVSVDGDQVSNLNMKAVSEDQNFNFEDKLEITTLDDDKAEIIVAAKGAEVMENSDSTLEFKVMLSAQPDEIVRIKLKSSDESELTIMGQATLMFNNENWSTPQTVMLHVEDDNFGDGTQIVHIDMTAASEDKNFDGLVAVTPNYSILDNESASVALTAAKTVFKPGEDPATTVTVRLSSQPEGEVPVKLSSTNGATFKLSNTDLKFTPDDWNTPQVVTVTTDPSVAASNKSIATISALATGPGSYANLKSNDVAMTLYYFIGSKDFAYTGKEQVMTLLPGRYKMQVWGASGSDGKGNDQTKGSHGGLGGYSEGILNLKEKTTTYVVVGGMGLYSNEGGGYNGGGKSYSSGWGGGGGTDIRLGQNSLYARVIVAGGGGGADNATSESAGQGDDGSGGYGGGTSGGAAYIDGKVATPVGATQTSGYKFGIGGDYRAETDTGGGGGGWFGGLGGEHYNGGGAGGSGFIWMGSPNVSASVIGGTWLLKDNQKFESGRTVAGNQSFPATGSGNETGHKGTGYARISFIDE